MIHDKWIGIHGSILDGLRKSPREQLKRRDKAWRWTFLHALFAVNDDIDDEIKAVLTDIYCNNPDLLNLLTAKDLDGDTPIHSVIKTGKTTRLCVLLDLVKQWHNTNLSKIILETNNNHGYDPLQLACVKRRYEMVELLLEVCIRERFCQDVTGVATQPVPAKMLTKALANGDWNILDIFLRVLKKLNYSSEQMLNLLDEKSERTWYLLMECDVKVLRETCKLLSSSEYNICLDKLHTDKYGSTMLHMAYRTDSAEKIKVLEDLGCKPDHMNTRKYKAWERSHMLRKKAQVASATAAKRRSLTRTTSQDQTQASQVSASIHTSRSTTVTETQPPVAISQDQAQASVTPLQEVG